MTTASEETIQWLKEWRDGGTLTDDLLAKLIGTVERWPLSGG